jgi:hypothetical protein
MELFNEQDVRSMAPEYKPVRHRSPAYPAVPLKVALERAKQFYGEQRDRPAPVGAALDIWGFKPKSGTGGVMVAALKQFGLMDELNTGDVRKIQLTDLALRIIRDERDPSPARDKHIKRAALTPKIYAEMWKEWRETFAADATMRFFLIHDKKYNEASVSELIADYKDTIKFAKLTDSDKLPSSEEGQEESAADIPQPEEHSFEQPPPSPKGVQLMEGERVVFTHEVEPSHGVRILVSGEVDDSTLDALEIYIQLQRKRIDRQRKSKIEEAN